VVPLAAYTSLEEAEDAGARLLANNIAVDVRGTTLLVDAQDEQRALQMLDLTEAPPEVRQPFHPCPWCGTADPLWYGKRKALLLAGAFLLSAWLAVQDSPAFWPTTLLLFAAFAIALWFIPEFECRNCHRRWSKGRR